MLNRRNVIAIAGVSALGLVAPVAAQTATPAASPVASSPYLWASPGLSLPAASNGKIAVVMHGLVYGDTLHNQMSVILQNRSSSDIWGAQVAVAVKDGTGALVGVANQGEILPNLIISGGYAFGAVDMTSVKLPAKPEFEFSITFNDPSEYGGRRGSPQDLIVEQAAFQSNGKGRTVVGVAQNKTTFSLRLASAAAACIEGSYGLLAAAESNIPTADIPIGAEIPFQFASPLLEVDNLLVAVQGWPN